MGLMSDESFGIVIEVVLAGLRLVEKRSYASERSGAGAQGASMCQLG
jgi:hypothetical protein